MNLVPRCGSEGAASAAALRYLGSTIAASGWYVVRDPAGNQYHRLSSAAYRFVGLLDGSRTVSEAWDSAGPAFWRMMPANPA